MDELRAQIAELGDLAKRLFEQQFIRCGGRKPADPTWDELEESERDEWWDRAQDAAPLLAEKDTEIGRLRREVEFEAKAEPWRADSIVAAEGHGYVNGGCRCECGFPTLTLRTYARHVASLLGACACVTDEQANQLANAGFSRPKCAVHPEVQR